MCKNKGESARAYNMWAYYKRNKQDKVKITKHKWTVNKAVSVIVRCTLGHEYNQMSKSGHMYSQLSIMAYMYQ